MQKLPLKLLEPGMIIAKPVVNEKGIALVSADTELTEKLIARLENMGVANVLVKGTPVKLDDYAPKSLQARLTDLEVGFSRHEDNDLMRKFKILVKAHFIKRDNEMKNFGKEEPMEDASAPPTGQAK